MSKIIESQTIEFKQIWKDDYLKTICAFANSNGGVLYIGLNDNGEVIGIDNAKELLDFLPNKINNKLGLVVDIIFYNEPKEYIEIKVLRTFAPVSYNGKFYKRTGSSTIELNSTNLTNFLLKKYGKTWDDIAVPEFTLDEINLDTIDKFKRLAKDRVPNIDREDDLKELLRKLNLYDGEYLKRATILLFGKNPQQYFIQSHSKIWVTKTNI